MRIKFALYYDRYLSIRFFFILIITTIFLFEPIDLTFYFRIFYVSFFCVLVVFCFYNEVLHRRLTKNIKNKLINKYFFFLLNWIRIFLWYTFKKMLWYYNKKYGMLKMFLFSTKAKKTIIFGMQLTWRLFHFPPIS